MMNANINRRRNRLMPPIGIFSHRPITPFRHEHLSVRQKMLRLLIVARVVFPDHLGM